LIFLSKYGSSYFQTSLCAFFMYGFLLSFIMFWWYMTFNFALLSNYLYIGIMYAQIIVNLYSEIL